MKDLVLGLCVVLATLGGSMAATKFASDAAGPAHAPAEKLENLRVDGVSVPALRNGKVSGYVIGSIVAIVPASILQDRRDALSVYLNEATFRTFYHEPAFDFAMLKPAETEQLAGKIMTRVNNRLGGSGVKEILIENLSFVTLDEIRTAQGRSDRVEKSVGNAHAK